MRMRKLNKETLSAIQVGQVIKVNYHGNMMLTGVVIERRELRTKYDTVIRIKTDKNSFLGLAKWHILKGDTEFAILKKHPPVGQFGEKGEWDFVSNHQ